MVWVQYCYVDQMEFDFGDLPRSSLNFLETFSVCDLLFQNSSMIFGVLFFV